eukprot:gene7233-7446_t
MDNPINVERAQNLQQATVSAHCAQDAVIQATAQHGAFRAHALNAFQKFKAAAKRIIVTRECDSWVHLYACSQQSITDFSRVEVSHGSGDSTSSRLQQQQLLGETSSSSIGNVADASEARSGNRSSGRDPWAQQHPTQANWKQDWGHFEQFSSLRVGQLSAGASESSAEAGAEGWRSVLFKKKARKQRREDPEVLRDNAACMIQDTAKHKRPAAAKPQPFSVGTGREGHALRRAWKGAARSIAAAAAFAQQSDEHLSAEAEADESLAGSHQDSELQLSAQPDPGSVVNDAGKEGRTPPPAFAEARSTAGGASYKQKLAAALAPMPAAPPGADATALSTMHEDSNASSITRQGSRSVPVVADDRQQPGHALGVQQSARVPTPITIHNAARATGSFSASITGKAPVAAEVVTASTVVHSDLRVPLMPPPRLPELHINSSSSSRADNRADSLPAGHALSQDLADLMRFHCEPAAALAPGTVQLGAPAAGRTSGPPSQSRVLAAPVTVLVGDKARLQQAASTTSDLVLQAPAKDALSGGPGCSPQHLAVAGPPLARSGRPAQPGLLNIQTVHGLSRSKGLRSPALSSLAALEAGAAAQRTKPEQHPVIELKRSKLMMLADDKVAGARRQSVDSHQPQLQHQQQQQQFVVPELLSQGGRLLPVVNTPNNRAGRRTIQ